MLKEQSKKEDRKNYDLKISVTKGL